MSYAEIESFSWAFVSLCVGVAIRSTFLAMVCAALDWLLCSRPAETRHALWRGMLIALLLFPVLEITLPSLWHASPALSRAQSMLLPQSQSSSVITRGVSRPMTIGARGYSTDARRVSWMLILTGAYLAVTVGPRRTASAEPSPPEGNRC